MASLFSYSFSLTPARPQLHEYAYNEFKISLAPHWKQIQNASDNTINFHSDELGAGITISIDFYEIPEDKAVAIAEKNLASRIDALEKATPAVEVFFQKSEMHPTGAGLEMSLGAEAPGEHVYLYLGYVSARKILNFTLVCKPDREAAIALFNELVASSYRPFLP